MLVELGKYLALGTLQWDIPLPLSNYTAQLGKVCPCLPLSRRNSNPASLPAGHSLIPPLDETGTRPSRVNRLEYVVIRNRTTSRAPSPSRCCLFLSLRLLIVDLGRHLRSPPHLDCFAVSIPRLPACTFFLLFFSFTSFYFYCCCSIWGPALATGIALELGTVALAFGH